MGNVGDRLEEARKRQGITIREASEATKVRTEYLSNFENDNFDFDLPDVYKRGFVKMYARFLKIDIEPFMTDVDALMQGRSKGKGGREFFGRMDLQTGSSAQDTTPSSIFNEGDSGVGVAYKKGTNSPAVPAAERLELGTDKTLYWKIGLVCVGTVVVVGLIALLIQTILSDGSAPADSAAQGTQQVAQATTPTVVITAKGDALVAVQELAEPNRRLINNERLRAGETRTVYPNGQFHVVSDKIENVGVQINGKSFNTPETGRKAMRFDANGPL